MRIPLSAPDITEDDIQAVVNVLRTSSLSLGPKLYEFEELLSSYFGVSHAVAVSSGTAALHLCVRALGISEGDEVIIPSYTFVAVANAVRYERATPVFVDIEERTLNLDPDCVEAAITPRTRAIIVVHTFGCPANLDQIMEIARNHNLMVIEDACEAIGAVYRGRKVGAFGDVAAFAFYPNKQITSGEGGAVVTNDKSIADRIRSLRNQGRDDRAGWFQHTELGYNYRISDINCALGIEQLKRVEGILQRREAIAERYEHYLSGFTEICRPALRFADRRISWFVYVVRLSTRFSAEHRDWVVEQMKAQGIGAGRYFAPIHLQPAYRSFPPKSANLLITESLAPRSLALPFFNRIRDQEIAETCKALRCLVHDAAEQTPD